MLDGNDNTDVNNHTAPECSQSEGNLGIVDHPVTSAPVTAVGSTANQSHISVVTGGASDNTADGTAPAVTADDKGDDGSSIAVVETTGAEASVPATGSSPIIGCSQQLLFEYRPVDPFLLSPPGAVGDICSWINKNAIRLQPLFALANAICAWATVIGRKVATETDLRSNIYAIGVGPSGASKDHSRKCVKQLFKAAALDGKMLGGEDIASDAAILNALRNRLSQLMQPDETGHLFGSWTSRHAQPYQLRIIPLLMKLFSSANVSVLGTEYGTKARIDVEEPNLSIYGTTVPETLFASLRPERVADGLLPRFLIFETADADPQPRRVEPVPPPKALAALMRRWYTRNDLPPAPPSGCELGDLEDLERRTVSPIIVRCTPNAEKIFDSFELGARWYRDRVRDNRGLDAMWARAVEHARKIALVIASGCGFDPAELRVTEEHAELAMLLVCQLVNNACSRIQRCLHENDYERKWNRVYAAIEASGHLGIARSALLRQIPSVPARELTEIILHLAEAERIVQLERKTPGRSATIFVASSAVAAALKTA
jgi:hypothetical protein